MYTSLYASMKSMPANFNAHLLLDAEKSRRQPAEKKLSPAADAMFKTLLIGTKGQYVVLEAFINQIHDAEEDWEKFIRMLVHYNELLPFLQHLLQLEVSHCAHEETLFRSNSSSVRLVSACMRLGGHALRDAITQPFARLSGRTLRRHLGLEFGEQPVAAASELLGLSLTFLLDLLEKHVHVCPFIPLLSIVRECVSAKYGNRAALSAVGGFVFLRFLTPCLTTLDLSGADDPKTVHRNVMFVSKVFQKLSNGSTFDESHPLKIQNIWIENAQEQRTNLLKNFSTSKNAINLFPDGLEPFNDVDWFMSKRVKLAFDLSSRMSHLPAYIEGCIEVAANVPLTVTDPYVLPEMSNKKTKVARSSAADQFRDDKLNEMLSKIEDRNVLIKMIKDQSLLLAKQQASLLWHKESLEQAKHVCGNIRDRYVAQLSAPDRFALEQVLATREDGGSARPTSATKSNRALRSLSCHDLTALARQSRWTRAVFRKQVLRIALSLPNVSGMPETINLLLRCPHCEKKHTTKMALLEHMKASCTTAAAAAAPEEEQEGESWACTHCGRRMFNHKDFTLHESLCNVNPAAASPMVQQEEVVNKKKGGSRWHRRKGSRASTVGRSFSKRSSMPNFQALPNNSAEGDMKVKSPKGSGRLRKPSKKDSK